MMLIPVQYIVIGFLFSVTLLFTILLRPKLSRFSQIIAYTLIIFISISYILHVNQNYFSGPERQFLNFQQGEFNHTATMSSVLLFSAGAMALLQSFARKKPWWNFPLWLYVASLFWFLATDEYFLIHETLGYWEEIYISVASLTTLLLLVVVWRNYTRLQFLALLITVGGMGVSAVGGVVLENFVGDLCFEWVPRNYCTTLPILEEIFEITGYATAFIGLTLFVEQTYDQKQWRRLHLALSSLALIWTFWLIFSYWVLPKVELRFIAQPIVANFDDGHMILRGYRITPPSTVAGGSVKVRLYWDSETTPLFQYGFTVNIVHPITGESIVRLNEVIDAPGTHTWFVGTIHWTEVEVDIPADIETPISPIIIPTVWRETSDGVFKTYTAETSSVPILNSGPIMTALPIVSNGDNNDDEVTVRFENGIGLSHTLLENEPPFTFAFHWTTSEAVSANLSQILHLVPDDGGDILIFDQPPFDDLFPTSTWLADISETDTITLEIPDDAEAGAYTLYTGLYDVMSGERIQILAEDAVNSLVPIAEVTIGSTEE